MEQVENSSKRTFKGVWIPKEIWLNKALTLREKILLVEIDSLDNEKGCYVKNKHFMDLMNLSEREIQRIIKSLITKEYVTSKFKYKKGSKEIEMRILRVNKIKFYGVEDYILKERKVVTKTSVGNDKNVALSGDKNVVVSNSLSNTLYINIYSRVIDYLNKKIGKSYKPTTKKTQSLIKARLNEGFNEEDFIKVIDKKVLDWKDTEFSQYLRPETLFGNKFEGYLNQGGKSKNGSTIKNNDKSQKFTGFKPHKPQFTGTNFTEDII